MWRISLSVLAVMVAVACGTGYPYPNKLTDYFGAEPLIKASGWVDGRTSAAVYVRESETMPEADLQVGIIVSYDKPAEVLQFWIDDQASKAETRDYHDPTPFAACTVARNRDRTRTYIALLSCRPGHDRAVCVQVDERLVGDEWSSCVDSNACYARLCESKWRDWGEEIEWLLADVLRKP